MNQYMIQTSDATKLISAKNANAAAKAFDPQCETLRDLELKTEQLV